MHGFKRELLLGLLVALLIGLCSADNDNSTIEAEWVEETEDEEVLEKHLARVVMVGLLTTTGALLLAHYCAHQLNLEYLPEAAVFMLVGMAVGLIIEFHDADLYVLTQFDTNVFFVGLLPPIIFNAGYSMKR
jgi:hypothetical protein